MDIKFRVKSPNHSKKIQQLLFKMGYMWGRDIKTNSHLNEQTLFADSSDMKITYSDADYFDQDSLDKATNFIEAFLLHPKQLEFLQNLNHINTMIELIIKNKIYYITDSGFLNDLLKQN